MSVIDLVAGLIEKKLFLEPNSIRSNRRTKEVSNARAIAIYCIHKITGFPNYRIARKMGLDHTSVAYALKKADVLIEIDGTYKNLSDYCIGSIKGSVI